MNFNVWNIKEMLSTPTAAGPNKLSMRSSSHSDYSSLSDSQLLFGSQFCPENVQSAAAPLELGTQLGQHNSQDSEPSIFTKYQTKPQLFDEEPKEKGSLNFGAGRVKSVLENFEVNRNKIKDKYDREVLSTFISNVKDKLQGLQACLDKFGEMFDSRNKTILVHLETISKTLQDALQSHCDSTLKALTDKSQMEQALLEMERRLAAKDAEILDLKSSIQLLKESLESLPAQLRDQHLKLCEEQGFLKVPNALAELHTFISSARSAPHTADNSSQTSPSPCWDGVRGEEDVHWPCCRGWGICSSRGWSQPHCVTAGEQQGQSPVGNQVTRDGKPGGDLNTPSGGKASPTTAAICNRENTSLQEEKDSLETQSCANHPCVCCSNSHILGGSQKKCCPVPQELPLPTPLRKAVRRGTRGFDAVMLPQQRQPQVCHLSAPKDTLGQRNNNLSTDCEVENAAVGNKAKQWPGRIPWNKVMMGKKTCHVMRKGELSRCADGLKQRKANGIIELESSRKNCFPRYMVATTLGSSNPGFAAPNPQILSSAQPRLTKNFQPVPRSNKSLQQLAEKRKKSLEIKKRANVSSLKRNFWDSSPQENIFTLRSTTGESQVSCFTLRSPATSEEPHPGNTLAQQNTACCSLVFDSDYSD
nr:interactor of HORMAD1 protein 1 isoform X1 [Columba livia]XP_021150343.1 interactor of HORMAD1 protein 1 isoform X1 [Columba livia]XP_021150344.1 interactor of HORMAD1 protein 1 isoform X1 [Columba livia]XP_021150345.1 interactor of HORMAD1 protein 1 isoform X1 [Columba livia]